MIIIVVVVDGRYGMAQNGGVQFVINLLLLLLLLFRTYYYRRRRTASYETTWGCYYIYIIIIIGRPGPARRDTIGRHTAWHGIARHDMAWHDTMLY